MVTAHSFTVWNSWNYRQGLETISEINDFEMALPTAVFNACNKQFFYWCLQTNA